MDSEKQNLALEALRERQKFSFHHGVESVLVYLAGPLIFVSYGATMARKDFAWQAVAQFALGLVAIGSWLWAKRLTRRNRVREASYLILGGLELFVCSSMLTTRGNGATLLLAAQVGMIYASKFGRRQLLLTAVWVAAFYLLGETAWYLHWWPMLELSRSEVYFRGLPFFVLILGAISWLLRDSAKMNELFLSDVQRFAAEQRNIIVSASQLGHTLDLAVSEIEDISWEFGQKTATQSEAIFEMDKSILELRGFASTALGAASDTQKAVFDLQETARRGSARLREVELRFEAIVDSYGVMRSQFDELSAQAVQIEGILQTNREVAGQIKILATNAAVQAAKAGVYGSGFRTVAVELKTMIQRIEASLVEGRKLLFDIRVRAKESSMAIAQNTGLLEAHAAELEETSRLVDSLEHEFVAAVQKMPAITRAAESQGHRLDFVVSGMSQVESSALALAQSTTKLQGAVEQIVKSHDSMSEMLSSSKFSGQIQS
ncbi:MAG: methyl-accepting chemotaxis protein [Myxococcota bacterium]|jgi:methyl-accepting chemotaxis protein|nr:methyl-accepting chemotaxis protein [Myxococcota bacterium]